MTTPLGVAPTIGQEVDRLLAIAMTLTNGRRDPAAMVDFYQRKATVMDTLGEPWLAHVARRKATEWDGQVTA